MKNELVVNTLFNKNKRKLRIRKNCRQRKKRDLGALTDHIEQYLENYETSSFCKNPHSQFTKEVHVYGVEYFSELGGHS